MRSYVFTVFAVLCLVPAGVKAQTGGVTMKSTVSETVALSVVPGSTQSDVDTGVVSSGNTVRITATNATVIRVPLLVRSNSSFKITATEGTAAVAQFSVLDARATGTLVSPQAVSDLNAPAPNLLDTSRPVLVVSGPRVSLGGTLNSPNNALRITLLIRLQPQPAPGSSIHLTLVASPGSLIQ